MTSTPVDHGRLLPAILTAVIVAVALIAANARAQSRQTDFSGRWVLTALRPAPDEPDTLEISAVEEFFIVQTPLAITIKHTSKSGKHPAAGTFEFGSGGKVTDGQRSGVESRWGVSFFGTQLMMSESTTVVDASGVGITTAHGSMWLLDERGRLVIEFREERTKERPKTATRVYDRRAGQ